MQTASEADRIARRWESFGYPSFRWFWIGRLIARIGNWCRNAAVPYVLFQLTHEPIWVGAAGFAYLFPQVLTSIPGGHLADKYDRRAVLLWTDACLLVLSILLVLSWALGAASPWMILLISAASSALAGLQMPAVQTVASEIVPRHAVADAIHLNVVAAQAGRAIGPLCAGFALAAWGAGWTFAVDVVALTFACLTLLFVRTTSSFPSNAAHAESAAASRQVSLRVIWRNPGLPAGVVMTTVISLFGAQVLYLATLLAQDSFGVAAQGYGALLSAYGFGAFVGALILSLLAHHRRRSTTIIVTGGLFGIALVALGVTHVFALGLVAMTVCGVCFSMSFGSLNAGIQITSPAHCRGKTVAFYLVALNVGAAVGSFIAGWASDSMAPGTVAILNGALLLVAAGAYAAGRWLRPLDGQPA